jgi:hypothetical protein
VARLPFRIKTNLKGFKMGVIYVIHHPQDERIYIGKSKDLKNRIKGHYRESKNPRIYRQYWFRSLLDKGLEPIFTVIGEAPNNNEEQVSEMKRMMDEKIKVVEIARIFEVKDMKVLSAIRKGTYFTDEYISESCKNKWKNSDKSKKRKFNLV